MSGAFVEGEIAHFVEDQQLRTAECLHPLREAVRTSVACHLFQQVSHRREIDRQAASDRRHAQADGEMGLADAGWTEKEHVLSMGDEAQARQIAQLAFIDRRLKSEVKLVERLEERQVRPAQLALDLALEAGRDLDLSQLVEILQGRPVEGRCLGG